MFRRILLISAVVFLLNTAYVAAFATPSIFYMGNVLLHLALGLALTVALVVAVVGRAPRTAAGTLGGFKLTAAFLAICAAIGLWIAVAGNTRDHHPVLLTHIVVGIGGTFCALLALGRNRRSIAFRTMLVTAVVAFDFP